MSYLGNTPGIASHRVVTLVTATSGQTLFTPSNGYLIGYVDVYLNGLKLVDGINYTATNGYTVTLTSGVTAGDKVELVAYRPRGLIIDAYDKLESDAKYMPIDATTTNVSEGTRLYFTNARADARIAVSSINALADVDTTSETVLDGQALAWNATASKWIPQTIVGGGGGGGSILNLDGGYPDSIFGGITAIDAGGVT